MLKAFEADCSSHSCHPAGAACEISVVYQLLEIL